MNTKKKGNAGERELVKELQQFGVDAVRNDQMYIGGYDNPDISVLSGPLSRCHVEVKRTERLRLREAFAQSCNDAAGKIPVVIHRANRQQWMLSMALSDFLKMLGGE